MWSALRSRTKRGSAKANPIERYQESAAAWAQRILDEAGEQAKAAGVSFELVHVPECAPAEGIIATAEKQGCDLIVMALHGRRGLGRLVLGSQANEVLAYSKSARTHRAGEFMKQRRGWPEQVLGLAGSLGHSLCIPSLPA